MKAKTATPDPITLQLLQLSIREKQAVVAACDAELRYTHLYNPHPAFSAEEAIGKRDDELAPPHHMAELIALKKRVLVEGRETRSRLLLRVLGEDRTYDVTAEPIQDDEGAVVGVATAAVDVTPPQDIRAMLREVADRLHDRSRALTQRWHDLLRDRLRVRPQQVFPGEALLDGMPHVVRWLVGSVANGHDLDAEGVNSVREIADFWRGGGYSIEESLIHVRILSEVLSDALAEEVAAVGDDLAASAGVRASRGLLRGIDTVKVALVASYRDAEEDRFTEFGSTLAHEIRGHLSAALSGVQLARLVLGEDREDREDRGARDPDTILTRVEHSLDQANGVVQSVRSLSSAASDRAEAWDRAPLRRIVESVVEDRNAFTDAEVRLTDDLSDAEVPDGPVRLILHNLIDNAVKYRDPDAHPCWVMISSERDPSDGHLVVHVGDNGLGIPEEEQERIFLRFRRGAVSRGDGFGLGLAIVRESARKFGGRVLLESEPGRGSTFSLTIPAEQIAD